ncbi:MAG: iron chelate uptake ABC transporter family permease subunit [Thermomicrobiales bacterium]|nr:iron chelate uptake ABC transporter family permease subunit [Thermomicrobiales bacterium]
MQECSATHSPIPGLIGVSTGAAFGAVLAIVLDVSLFGIWTLPIFAFTSGLIGTVIVYLIARHDGRTKAITLLLAVIALNAIAGAAVGLK